MGRQAPPLLATDEHRSAQMPHPGLRAPHTVAEGALLV